MNSSVFAVRSLLAVAICSNFPSARRIGKQLPPVPTSVMPGRQPRVPERCTTSTSPPVPPPTRSCSHSLNMSLLEQSCAARAPRSLLACLGTPEVQPQRAPPAAWARPKGRAAFPSTFSCRHGRILFQCRLLERQCLAEAAPAHICFPLGDSDLKLELIKSIAPVRNAAKQWWCEENPPSERLGFRLKALIFSGVRERKRGRNREREREK